MGAAKSTKNVIHPCIRALRATSITAGVTSVTVGVTARTARLHRPLPSHQLKYLGATPRHATPRRHFWLSAMPHACPRTNTGVHGRCARVCPTRVRHPCKGEGGVGTGKGAWGMLTYSQPVTLLHHDSQCDPLGCAVE